MNTITLNDGNAFILNEFSYDSLSDILRFEYSAKSPVDFKNELFSDGALDRITDDDGNVFEGYTKVTRFYMQYDQLYDMWSCYISLEKDETMYQKLMNRIEELEKSNAELTVMKRDISALQLVNAKSLSEKGLISSEIATRLAENAAELSNIDGQIAIGDLKGGTLK